MSDLVSQNLNMIFKTPKGDTVHALKDVNFTLKKGELLTVQEARDAGILGIDITSVTDKFMKENPGMLRTFIEVTHEANARYASGKSDMNVIAKDAEMKVADMKETIGGFKFLSPAETEKSMTSGNLAGFLKGMSTPDGAVDTSFLPL